MLWRGLSDLWRQLRSGHLDRARLARQQQRQLRELVAYAARHSAYYRERFAAAGLRPEMVRGLDDLPLIPLTDKASLKAAPRRQLLSDDATLGSLSEEKSSGSTGSPFATAFDRGYLLNRNFRFLRGLWAAGYRWPMRLLLVTGARERQPSRWLRWHYASIKVEPAQTLATYEQVRPAVLYGCVTPLRELALAIRRQGSRTPPPRSVITTAESLDAATRKLLRETFGCPVYDFYGMTEMGLIGWECPAQAGYHLALDSVLVERLPLGDGSGRYQLACTNLALRGMPLLRYASGDIGYGYEEERCACGSRLPRLRRVEGRQVDVITLPDGRRCSPYQFTCELEKIAGLGRYRVVQERAGALRIEAEPDTAVPLPAQHLRQAVMAAIATVTGDSVTIEVELVERIEQERGRKFRVVEGLAGEQSASDKNNSAERATL